MVVRNISKVIEIRLISSGNAIGLEKSDLLTHMLNSSAISSIPSAMLPSARGLSNVGKEARRLVDSSIPGR
jgi:hypothetical protein